MENSATPNDVFVAGLRNAHAMENQALAIIKPQLKRLENYPEVSEILDRHLHEAEEQIRRLESIFQTLGETASGLKDTMMSLTGTMAAVTDSMAPDAILKNSMANFAFEHFEIAAYMSLITTARLSGAHGAIPLLEESLTEEQHMADQIEQMLPTVTERYITLKASGEKAGV